MAGGKMANCGVVKGLSGTEITRQRYGRTRQPRGEYATVYSCARRYCRDGAINVTPMSEEERERRVGDACNVNSG